MAAKDWVRELILRIHGRARSGIVRRKVTLYRFSNLLILAGAVLFIWQAVIVPTQERNRYERNLQSLFKERNLAVYEFTNDDFGYKKGLITADRYKESWRTLGSLFRGIREREKLLLEDGKRFKDERIYRHHEGLGYVIQAVDIIEGFFEDEEQEANPLAAAGRRLQQGLELINKAEDSQND